MKTVTSSSRPVNTPRFLLHPITSGFEPMSVRWSLPFRRGNPSPDAICDRLLVSCAISRPKAKASSGSKERGSGKFVPRDSLESFLVYPKSVKLVRPASVHLLNATPPDRSGSSLQGFSQKSKNRLRFLAANSADHISSQFCMSYGDVWPIHGRECKRQLDVFLKSLRKKFPSLMYIWIGEFQSRGAPHFHFFSNLSVSQDNHDFLSAAWHEIAGVSSEKHERVHIHSKNFIPWDMGTGSYLCKYLDKAHQKQIPVGFSGFGRWWGNSSNIKPVPVEIHGQELELFLSDSVNVNTGEVLIDSAPQFLIRTCIKYQKKVNRSPWAVKRSQSMTVLTGAAVFRQALQYLELQSKRRFEK